MLTHEAPRNTQGAQDAESTSVLCYQDTGAHSLGAVRKTCMVKTALAHSEDRGGG